MPKLDIRLVFFPTEEHFPPVPQGRKINEAAFDVFDLNLAGGKLVQRLFAIGDGPNHGVGRVPSDVLVLAKQRREACFGFAETFLAGVQFRKPLADVGQERAGFINCIMFGKAHQPFGQRLPHEGQVWQDETARDCFDHFALC